MAEKVSHAAHRQRMRDRCREEGLSSMEPHQVLEMLLFRSLPRCDTNPIAHRLLEEYGTLTAALTPDHPVPGAGEATMEMLRQTDRELWEAFLDSLQSLPVLTRESFAITAAFVLRRKPDCILVLLCDAEGRFREMQPVDGQDLCTIADALIPLLPEDYMCHLAYTADGNDRTAQIRALRNRFLENERLPGWIAEMHDTYVPVWK